MTLKFERLSVELGDDTSTAKGALLITHLGTTGTKRLLRRYDVSLCIAVWYKEVTVCEVFLEQQLVEEPSVGAF